MSEQDHYKEILQNVIDQTNDRNIQTIDQVIQELSVEIHKYLTSSKQKVAE